MRRAVEDWTASGVSCHATKSMRVRGVSLARIPGRRTQVMGEDARCDRRGGKARRGGTLPMPTWSSASPRPAERGIEWTGVQRARSTLPLRTRGDWLLGSPRTWSTSDIASVAAHHARCPAGWVSRDGGGDGKSRADALHPRHRHHRCCCSHTPVQSRGGAPRSAPSPVSAPASALARPSQTAAASAREHLARRCSISRDWVQRSGP